VDPPVPATPDTLYRLASVTKAFTAVLLHRLAAQGVVGLDDTLVAHWPGFTMYDPWEGTNGTTITLRHLASHMAGFGRVTPPSINSSPRD
jgi:CubicO group peptidase (beta-lactamase class C family)